jgi:hypothetical protein
LAAGGRRQRQNAEDAAEGDSAGCRAKLLTHMASFGSDGLANVLNRHKIRT